MVWYVVLGFGFLMVGAAPLAEHNGRSFRNALNQQGLQTILQSIEERLRNLDQVYSNRYASPGPDIIRKIELLETKLSRMESQVQTQLDKVSENLSSKNFKDDLSKDQLFRKMDSVYERINHKLSYLESKVDMDVLKLQTKIEAAVSKIERLDHSFSVRQADMEAEVSDAVEIMENVRNNVLNVENKLMNVTRSTIESSFDKQTNFIQEKFDNVTHLLTQITRTNTTEQCNQKDVLNDFTSKDTHLTKTFKGYEDQIQSYGNKVNNMYNELWKKSTTIENTIKNSVLLMNITRKEIQDLKKAGHKSTVSQSQNDGQLETIVDSFTNTIQRKFAELGRKLESNFENVMLVQNLFLESCHRIQMDEAQLESKISAVLEKLLDAVTNRSINTFKEIQSMEELIKSHDSNIYRTLNQNTNSIIKLSEKTSEDRKKLEKILSTIRKDIGNALETIQNEISSEDHEHSQRFDTITNILLELQEQVNNLDSRVNEDNINYNAKQILQDILVATKSLPDKDTFAERLNVTILPNMLDISRLMTNIYHLLATIDSKINNSLGGVINSANITKDSAKQNEKGNVSTVTEPVDVVLQILPEKNNSNKSLSRFNYTLIMDEKTDTENTTKSIWELFTDDTESSTKIYSEEKINVWDWFTNSPTNDDSLENFENEEVTTTENIKQYNPIFPFFGFTVDSEIPEPTITINKNDETTIPNSLEKDNNFITTTRRSKFRKTRYRNRIATKNIPVTFPAVISKAEETVYTTDMPVKNETNSYTLKENDASIEKETETPTSNNKDGYILINGYRSSTEKQNKNSYISGSTIADIPVSDAALKRIKIESVTDMPVKNETNSYTLKENDASIEKETETPTSNNKDGYILINGYGSSTEKHNKNSYISGSTIADIPVSDVALKRIKIESVTKETTEILDDTQIRTTISPNSFEYTDLKNNTNEENIRDEYEWDYEE